MQTKPTPSIPLKAPDQTMDDSGTFFWGLMFGAIGMGYIVYGKNQQKLLVLCLGVALCVFPYFVTDVMQMLLIGAALTLAPMFFGKS
jgi:hypothetical protein